MFAIRRQLLGLDERTVLERVEVDENAGVVDAIGQTRS